MTSQYAISRPISNTVAAAAGIAGRLQAATIATSPATVAAKLTAAFAVTFADRMPAAAAS